MNLRQIALRILDEYEAGEKYINLSLSSHLTDKLSREDKAALTALLYTSVEKKLTYDYYICALSKRSEKDIDPHTKNILRLGLCQILDMHSIPDFAAVNETVKLASGKGERAFVNGVLRTAAREKENLPTPDPKKNYNRYLSVKYSFPLPLVKHFDLIFGSEKTEKLLEFYNTEKYTDITVNTTKISVDNYLKLLCDKQILAEMNPYVEQSIRIRKSVNPELLPGFDDGYFFVQDRASAIAVSILSPKDEDVIVDCCAAPGGKSFASAILASDGCSIHSFDLHESKISLITSGAKRLGLNSVKAGQRDALVIDESLIGVCDKVICDAPCSGLGVLGKKPDIRYKDLTVLDQLPTLQLDILSSVSRYLKSGGEMIYSTCTLNPSENERVVESFIDTNSDFELVPFDIGLISAPNGHTTLLPFVHGTDGFFIAKIRSK